eukprot:scaffold16407_cov51-Attheya_sp.AAC.3
MVVTTWGTPTGQAPTAAAPVTQPPAPPGTATTQQIPLSILGGPTTNLNSGGGFRANSKDS